jgi:hypothetical protein
VDEEHERHFVHGQRAIALAHLHFVEAAAVFQALFDRGDAVRRERLSDGNARELEDDGVGDGQVAVDADFRDGLGLQDRGEREHRDHFGTRTFDETSALR